MGSLGLLAWIQRLAARIEQLERGVAWRDGSVANAKLANMAEARIKGRAAGSGTGAPVDLTGTQATAILDAMVGDSGSGGTKGLVPAPAAGDAAAGKFLKADGTFAVPPGTGSNGVVVQVVNTQTGAVATGTGTIPFDDTIPQNTEGNEFMTLAITPTSAANVLRIDVVLFASTSAATSMVVAGLFQDTTADALAVGQPSYSGIATAPAAIAFSHYMTAGTTSATTFKVRAGSTNAGTTTFNGQSAARKFGGVHASSITIAEIVP
jgi:hypothetical protein